jgi:hypothetical protein
VAFSAQIVDDRGQKGCFILDDEDLRHGAVPPISALLL